MIATIQGRISDNVLDDKDHTTFTLHILAGCVVGVSNQTGVYATGSLVGMTLDQLADWTEPDDTPRHPMVFCELFDPVAQNWRDGWSVEDIIEALIR